MATPGAGNWVYEKGGVTEKDIKALEKAKRLESRQERHGYKWVNVNSRTSILVPCDKEGNPTVEGLRKIKLLKKSL